MYLWSSMIFKCGTIQPCNCTMLYEMLECIIMNYMKISIKDQESEVAFIGRKRM